MTTGKKRLVSGIKSTGELHIGNYFGAMRQQLEYQNDYESFIFIADYHALTTAHGAARLRENIYHIAAGYLAIGIDPSKSLLYKQSDIQEHTELAWVFNSITSMGYLLRGHAYKDAQAKGKDVTVGTFDYPMLMAADILLYDADVVPVGKDQKQHIEFARDTAEKFNSLYGDTFNLPEGIIPPDVATIPGLDGRKMSKSYKNTIPLFAKDSNIETLVMGIVTDSKGTAEPKDPKEDTLFAYHRLFSPESIDDLQERYESGSIGYKESKEILVDNVKKFIKPIRNEYEEYIKDTKKIKQLLSGGAEKAQSHAREKMDIVRERIGISL